MIAVEQGLVTLDANVRELVPELKHLEILVGFEESENLQRVPILKEVADPISMRYVKSWISDLSQKSRSSNAKTHTDNC